MRLRLLDTNIWIALAKCEPGPVARLRQIPPAQIVTCSVVKAELLFGARKSRRVAENLEGIRRLLEPVVSLPFDDRAAEHYGLIRASLEEAGTPIGANDLLIASIALAHNCQLVTGNRGEFERVVGLPLEVWP